ncbi:glycosyltransferase family 87 protein [Actinophytocola xanthii]|nr:glycosyltransferase family 87 protein [Actinophytocola xanthii]
MHTSESRKTAVLRFSPLLLIPLAVGLAVVARLWIAAGRWTMIDLKIFQYSGLATWTGADPYHLGMEGVQYSMTYPPFAGVLLGPLAPLPEEVARILWLTGIFLALQATVWLVARRLGVAPGTRLLLVVAAASAALLLFDPVWSELFAGQVNTFLMLVILADLCRRSGSRWRGVGIGLATGFKLIPGLFIVYFAVTRQFREMWTALAAFAATVAVGFVAMPGHAWSYWTEYVWQTDRMMWFFGTPRNQSLRATLERFGLGAGVWLVVAAVVLVLGMLLCVRLYRRGWELESGLACALLMLLVSPVSWVEYWVWLVPVLTLAAVYAVRSRAWPWAAVWVVIAAAGVVAPYTWLDFNALPDDLLSHLQADTLVLLGVGLLAAAAALGTRPPTAATASCAPARPWPARDRGPRPGRRSARSRS